MKLTSLSTLSSIVKEFLKDIFGYTTNRVHEAGMVDGTSKAVLQKASELHA